MVCSSRQPASVSCNVSRKRRSRSCWSRRRNGLGAGAAGAGIEEWVIAFLITRSMAHRRSCTPWAFHHMKDSLSYSTKTAFGIYCGAMQRKQSAWIPSLNTLLIVLVSLLVVLAAFAILYVIFGIMGRFSQAILL